MTCRTQWGTVVAIGLVGVGISPSSWALSRITAIDFKGNSDPSVIQIRGDGPLNFDKQDLPQDNQVIIEIKDAQISKSASRKIDTSSFPGKISLISPYQVTDTAKPDTVRVVIQLREPGAVAVAAQGNTLDVTVPNDGATAPAAAEAPVAASAPTPPLAKDETTPAPDTAEAQGPKSRLERFEENKETKRFTGRPITLQVRDVDAADVFRLIGEASGFNIVMGDDVKGKLTLSLIDVPWDQALDIALHSLRLGAERHNNVLRIATLNSLTAEKTEELKAKQAAQANSPRITRVFNISYANLKDLETILAKFTTGATGGAGSPGGTAASPGVGNDTIVQADPRTNSIVVRDTPENIERMKTLISLLDTQTPQVMIEAKIIEASESFSKNISGSLGFSNGGEGQSASMTTFASFAGANPVDPLVGTPGVFSTGSGITQFTSASGAQSGGFGFSPNLSFLGNNLRLNALLNIGETESQVKVVSSPKTVVLNKQAANIVQGTPVLVPGQTTTSNGVTISGTTVQQALLSLNVTPTVTNDGSVLMDLKVSRDVPVLLGGGQSGIGNRNMTTNVLVDSGSTLVIGGIYTMTNNDSSSGFPFLRKIPIVGWLFGSETSNTSRSELFIFITPRILNPKEAGITPNG